MILKKTSFLLLAILLSLNASNLLASITLRTSFSKIQSYIIQNEDNKLPCNQEEIECQENLVVSSIIDPTLMMYSESAEKVGETLEENILNKNSSSEIKKPVNTFNVLVDRVEAGVQRDTNHVQVVGGMLRDGMKEQDSFIEDLKNYKNSRSAFIEELQKIWTSDIISTSSKVAIKLVADTRYEALKADLIAIEAQDEAYAMDLYKELEAYKTAKTAWGRTVIACKKAESANLECINEKELEELTCLHKTAEVRTFIWTANIVWVQARKAEIAIKDPDHITEEEAIEIEAAWGETVKATQAALDKLYEANLPNLVTIEESEINALLTEAKMQEANWAAIIKDLKTLEEQGVQIIGANSKQNREDILLQEIKKNKAKADQLAWKAVWSEKNQRAYESWELPGELPSFSLDSFEQIGEERTSEGIEPPEILNEELEEKGRQLLRSERAVQKVRQEAQLSTTVITAPSISTSSHLTSIAEVTYRDFINHEEQLEASIMAESLNPTPENKLRWEARKQAEQLIIEAAKIAKRERALKITKSEENEEASESDETATLASSISKTLSNLGSSFGVWRPKAISVLGSITEEVSKTSSSKGFESPKASKKTAESDLERADREVEEAEAKWEEMIFHPEHGGETRRIIDGGLPPNASLEPSLLVDFWKKADKKAFQAVQAQEKIEKEKRIAEELQERWQANTARWKARAEAELQERKAQEAEKNAKNLLEEKATIRAKSNATEKEKQAAHNAAALSKTAAEEARSIATKAQEEWLERASDHHSIISADHPEDEINNLTESDKAVNDLWIEVTNSYDKDERERDEDEFLQEERIKKEAEQYPITLVAKREADITKCFKGVKQALEAAKKQYDCSTKPASRAEAQRLYEEADRIDLSLRQTYAKIVKNEAITDARKKTPGAIEAWIRRTTDSEDKRKEEAKRVTFKAPCKDLWADENRYLLARLTAIEISEKEALKTFQKEETRLNNIAIIWSAVIESKRRALRLKIEKAVKSYIKGDPTEWNTLSSEERAKYNNEIKVLNYVREEEIKANLQKEEELAIKLQRKANKTWKYDWNKAAAEKAANIEEERLIKIKKEEKERQDAMRWIKLTPEEKEVEIEFEQAEIVGTENNWNILLHKAQTAVATLEEEIKVNEERASANNTGLSMEEKVLLATSKKQCEIWMEKLHIAKTKASFIRAKAAWNSFFSASKSITWQKFWNESSQLKNTLTVAEEAISKAAWDIVVRDDDITWWQTANDTTIANIIRDSSWSAAISNVIRTAAENDRSPFLKLDRSGDAAVITIRIAAQAAAEAAWKAVATKVTADAAVKTAKLVAAAKRTLLDTIKELANAWAASKDIWNDSYNAYLTTSSATQIATVARQIYIATDKYVKAVEADFTWNVSQKDQNMFIAASEAVQKAARLTANTEVPWNILSTSNAAKTVTEAIKTAAISSIASATENNTINNIWSATDNARDVEAAWLIVAKVVDLELIDANKNIVSTTNKLAVVRNTADNASVRVEATTAAIKAATRAVDTAGNDIDVRYPLLLPFFNNEAKAKAKADAEARAGIISVWYTAFGDTTVRDPGRANAAMTAMAVWHAIGAARATTRAESVTDADRYTAIAGRAADQASLDVMAAYGTIWAKEVKWAAQAAREAHDFAKSINIYFKPFGAKGL